MKKNKILKALGLFGCAILLVAVSIAGTMAYMTSTATVENTFTVGKVAITMDEAKVDQYGVAADLTDRTDKNTYKLIPGHTYAKDPTIHVEKGSEVCYLFVKVVNGISAIDGGSINAQLTAHGWKVLDGNVWYYTSTVDAREATADVDVKVFDTFTINNDADVSGYATVDNAANVVNVTAYAIQADGFADAAAAWAAAPASFKA